MASAVSAEARNGWYLGLDLGASVTPDLVAEGWDSDVPTVCDGFINNDGSGNFLETPSSACKQSTRDQFSWLQRSSAGSGVLAGITAGYRLGSFRFEGEYFHHTATYDDLDNSVRLLPAGQPFQGGKENELLYVEAGIDDVLSHNIFANFYYDWHSGSKFTPYVGVGIGFSEVSLDFYSRWTRNYEAAKISTFSNPALNERLAGTTTIGRNKFSETLFGYQGLFGMDYSVNEKVSIGFKLRWVVFDQFRSRPREWDQIRSHESAVSPEGEKIHYQIETDDIEFWSLSFGMKYQF